jgi:hypothetical protein
MSRARLTLAFSLALALSGLPAAAGAPGPELTLAYSAGNTLELIPPGGSPVSAGSPGAQLPFGAYQVDIIDDAADGSDPVHMFQLSGPGVNLSTDLQGGDDKSEIYQETLAASSTYTFSDTAEPGLAPIVFRTTGTTVSSPAQTVSTPRPVGTTPSSTNVGVLGSGVAKKLSYRGTLQATVGASGKPTLSSGGRPVSTLRAGRYAISVVDRSPHAGWTIQEARRGATTLTGNGFVGRKTRTVALAAGQWLFYSTFLGKKTYFFVES